MSLDGDGKAITYTYTTSAPEPDELRGLLAAVDRAGLAYRDLRTSQSTLEDIFVSLVRPTS